MNKRDGVLFEIVFITILCSTIIGIEVCEYLANRLRFRRRKKGSLFVK